MVIFIGWVEPYKEKSFSFFERFNEVCLMILNYHIFCFMSFVVDIKTRNLVGWSMIGTIGLCLFTNFIFVTINAVKDAYKKYRLKFY